MATVTVETPLSDDDRRLLEGLLSLDDSDRASASDPEPEKPAPAKKATGAAKKAAANKPAPEVEETNPPSEPEAAEDEVGLALLIKETVAVAQKVMKAADGSDKVRLALQIVGAERVGRLKDRSQVEEFLALIAKPLEDLKAQVQ